MSQNLAPAGPRLPSLDAALAEQWRRQDATLCHVTMLVQLVALTRARSHSERLIGVWLIVAESLLSTLSRWCGALPGGRVTEATLRFRAALALLTRTGVMLLPHFVDVLFIAHPGTATTAAAAAAAGGGASRWPIHATLSSVGAHLRAVAVLLTGLAFLHACISTPVGWQLPPLLHSMQHTLCVALLLRRAPKVCHAFVSTHPANANVVRAGFWVLRQCTSALSLGSRSHLDSAARAMSDCQKCTAITWALLVSLGLVYATLLVWHAQLQAAQRHTAEERLRREEAWLARQHHHRRRGDGGGGGGGSPGREQALPSPHLPGPSSRHEAGAGLVGVTPAAAGARAGTQERHGQMADGEGGWEAWEREAAELQWQAAQLEAPARELAGSQYSCVCQPALQVADALRWPGAVGLSALVAFVGALAWQARGASAAHCPAALAPPM